MTIESQKCGYQSIYMCIYI